jgi:hypothetical protein
VTGCSAWVPAFAGMTVLFESVVKTVRPRAGMLSVGPRLRGDDGLSGGLWDQPMMRSE